MLKSIDWRTLAFTSITHTLFFKCWMKNRLLTQNLGVEWNALMRNLWLTDFTTNGTHNNGIQIQTTPHHPIFYSFEPAHRSIR